MHEILSRSDEKSSVGLYAARGCASVGITRVQLLERQLRGPDGRWRRHQRVGKTTVKTLFGKIAPWRSVYVCGKQKATSWAPLDDELGLMKTGFSLHLIGLATYLCSKMAFAETVQTLKQCGYYAPSTKSLQTMVDQVAPLARSFIDELPPPEDDGEILVIEVDGRGAPQDRGRKIWGRFYLFYLSVVRPAGEVLKR